MNEPVRPYLIIHSSGCKNSGIKLNWIRSQIINQKIRKLMKKLEYRLIVQLFFFNVCKFWSSLVSWWVHVPYLFQLLHKHTALRAYHSLSIMLPWSFIDEYQYVHGVYHTMSWNDQLNWEDLAWITCWQDTGQDKFFCSRKKNTLLPNIQNYFLTFAWMVPRFP